MKIVVLSTGHRPNDDRIYYKEILSLLTKYPRIDLIVPVNPGESYDLCAGVVLHSLPRRCGLVGRLLTVFMGAIKVIRLKSDICHFHDLDFVVMVPLIRLFSKAKVIYDSHEVYPESMLISSNIPRALRPLAAWTVNLIEKRCARFCSVVITADDPCTKSFQQHRIAAVSLFNYPRLSLFSGDAQRAKKIAETFSGRKILLYEGTMSRDRGLFHMLDGMQILKEMVPDALLLLVGLNDPGLLAQANEQIRRENLTNYVRILPWVSHTEIADYISCADVGLVPWQPSLKNSKNIPIKIFEYMICGIPLLAANLPSIAYYLGASGAGVMYDSTDSMAFAIEAQRLLIDPVQRVAMAKAGRASVRDRWNWGEMEKILLSVYAGMEPK